VIKLTHPISCSVGLAAEKEPLINLHFSPQISAIGERQR
jgi:hypothetical protein